MLSSCKGWPGSGGIRPGIGTVIGHISTQVWVGRGIGNTVANGAGRTAIGIGATIEQCIITGIRTVGSFIGNAAGSSVVCVFQGKEMAEFVLQGGVIADQATHFNDGTQALVKGVATAEHSGKFCIATNRIAAGRSNRRGQVNI